VRLEAKHVGVCTRDEICAKGRKQAWVVELVAVDADHPRLSARIGLEQAVRKCRSS
jgi:hypothetical protein